MTDMILAVRITADGAQLVGQLSAAEAKALDLKSSMSGAAAGTKELSAAADGAARATTAAATGARALATAEKEQARAAREAAREEKQREQAVMSSLARQRQGYQQVGFQAQDFFTQIGAGTSVQQAFVQQSGQMVGALQLIADEANGANDAIASFADFLGGPWGIALGVAIPLIGILAGKLLESGEASKAADNAIRDLSASQGELADYIDVATGKIKEQITQLQILAQVRRQEQALDVLRDAQRVDQRNLASAAIDPFVARSPLGFRIRDSRNGGMGFVTTGAAGQSQVAELNRRLQTDARFTPEQYMDGIRSVARTNPQLRPRLDDIQQFAERVAERRGEILRGEALQRAVQGDATVEDRRLLGLPEIRPERERRPRRGPDPAVEARRQAAAAQRLADFGDRAAESIARINDRWNEQPQLIDRARQDTAALDALIADLQDKKPPNFAEMIAGAQEARATIEDGLLKPFNDLVKNHDRQRELQLLVLQGREDEAEVLSRVRRLQDQGVDVTAEQRAEIERMVAAEQQINDLLDKRDAIIGAYRQSIGDLRSSIEDLFSGGSLGDFSRNITANVRRLRGQLLTEQLFGDGFRQLERQMRQATGLEGAVEQLDTQVRGTSDSFETVATAADRLATSLTGTAGRIGSGAGSYDLNSALSSQIGDWFAQYRPVGMDGEVFGPDTAVSGRRDSSPQKGPTVASMRPNDYYSGVARVLAAPIVALLERIDETLGTRLSGKLGGVIEGGIQGYMRAGPVGALLGATRDLVGSTGVLGKKLEWATKGAETGTQIAGLGKALGLKMSTTGSQIGGAVGSALPIPGGEIIGSVIGGLLGGLFKKTPKASTTISSVTGDLSVSGNKAAAKAAVGDLGAGIQSTLAAIAEQLGGSIGNFAVSIGQRGDSFRVAGSAGADVTSKKAKGLLYNGKDAEEAARIAILDAIGDGAIAGISDKVKKALGSSTDLDRALKEALKVQEVEDILGGLGAALEKQFRSFEAQAQERLRIAGQYGFDVVKIEARNAEDRKKLVDSILESRVGSLQQLLQDFQFGDLFEGTAADRRQALLAQVAKAKADAEAGVDGAAQKLADLTRQLVDTSRAAYGTAGPEFATDRANAISAAERVIQLENERIKAAQDAALGTKAALEKNNELTNETNDLLAQIAAGLAQLGFTSPVTGGPGLSVTDIVRQADLR